MKDGATDMLNPEDLEVFVRDGFIVKKSLLSADKCRHCVEATWKILADQGITKDRSTWHRAYSRRGVIKLRDQVSESDDIRDAVLGCPGVLDVIESLMGAAFVDCGIRGVYPTVPIPRRLSRPYEPHIEGHPCQVVVMYYLQDVRSRNGGLLVWPGSHRSTYLSHTKIFDFSAGDKFLSEYRRYNLKTPVEITGSAGDVLFFHHRLLHSGSNNFRDSIRFAALNDFIPGNFEDIRSNATSGENMWDYWSDDVRVLAHRLRDLSPLAQASPDLVRRLLISSLGMARRIKGSHVNDYEERAVKLAVRNGDQ